MCLAIPGRIVELLPERENLALVEVSGVRRKIDVARPCDRTLIDEHLLEESLFPQGGKYTS